MTDDQIKYMTERFLAWKLPANFSPDDGISFKAAFNENTPHPMRHEPSGTNLFDYTQAEAMIRHMVDGMPAMLAARPAAPVEDLVGTLFDAISHGDETHRAWLKQAIDDHFAGRPVKRPAAPVPAEGGESSSGRWYAADQIDALVRQLDVALNGDGAAPQAMLCDLVSQFASAPTQPEAGDDDVVLYGGPITHDGGICHYIDLTGEFQPEAGGEIERGLALALQLCRERFAEYVVSHRSKGTLDADEKAERNDIMVRMIDDMLAVRDAHRSAQGTVDE